MRVAVAETFHPAEFVPGVGRVYREGSRNDTLTRRAGALRRRGASQVEIEAKLLALNKHCSPPLDPAEVSKIAASVARYEPGGPDPLVAAWSASEGEYESNYERFLALARQLQSARGDEVIALPLERIGELMGVHWNSVRYYRSKAVATGLLEPAGEAIPHVRAGLYRFLSSNNTLSSNKASPFVTSGLVTKPLKKAEKALVTNASSSLVTKLSPQTPDQVLRLAALGWRMFPCQPRDKNPLIKKWPELATCEAEQLQKWSARYPNSNWAVATGSRSGVWVLDVDGEEGRVLFDALFDDVPDVFEATLCVKTARGVHMYWRWPTDGTKIPSTVGKFGKGLDVRSDGGYALVPPSIHPISGAAYEWLDGRESRLIAEAPEWLTWLVSAECSKFVIPLEKDTATSFEFGWNVTERVS
jgi:hypothetical protein